MPEENKIITLDNLSRFKDKIELEIDAVADTCDQKIDGQGRIIFCTQAEFDAASAQGELVVGAYYVITDDNTDQVLNGKADTTTVNAALALKADKPADILSTWVVPNAWEDLRDILEAQPMTADQWYEFFPQQEEAEYKEFHDTQGNYYNFTASSENSCTVYFYAAIPHPDMSAGVINGIISSVTVENDVESGDRYVVFSDEEVHSNFIQTTADLANKQDHLISSYNIKTVNGNSLLGSGDLDLGPEWTVITSEMTDSERIHAIEAANLPYVIYNRQNVLYFYTYRDSNAWYHFSRLSVGGDYNGTDVSRLSLGQIIISPYGHEGQRAGLQGTIQMNSNYINDQYIPSTKAVSDFVASNLSSYYTKTEVDVAIQAAIGDALAASY